VPLGWDEWLFMAPFFFASPVTMELVKVYLRLTKKSSPVPQR